MVIIFVPLPGTLKLITLLLLTITQFCASIWYSLSYIPYGRRTALRMLKNSLGIEDSSGYSNVGIQLEAADNEYPAMCCERDYGLPPLNIAQ